MSPLPTVVSHTYDADRGPFRNICDLPDVEAEAILDQLRATGKRRIKPDYLARRRKVEDWLVSESRERIGAITLRRPIYFFLGDFADGLDPLRPLSFVMPLAEFSPDMITFTYPDSMASLPIATRPEHLPERRDYHGKVFTFEEIKVVVAESGMPDDRDRAEQSMRRNRFIEVQVWNDAPIKRHLGLL